MVCVDTNFLIDLAKKDKAAIERARRFLGSFARIIIDDRSAMQYGELYNSLRSSTIGDRALFIASIALANGQTLITRNVKHFERVPGLKVESW